MKTNSKITFNDTPDFRAFTSENFNWILDKESGVSCAWAKTAKENPAYDEIGPETITWKLTEFNLDKYMIYFNFLTNIKIKNEETNEVTTCELKTYKEINKIKDSLICMSTFGNIIFEGTIDFFIKENKNLKKFIDYIKLFNINPILMIDFIDTCYFNSIEYFEKTVIKNLKQLCKNIIIKVEPKFFNYQEIINCISSFKEQSLLASLNINVNNDNYGQTINLLTNISNDISVTLNFNNKPYLAVEKFLKIQNFCKEKGLTNIVMTQCSKFHYSRQIIGSILHEIECSAARFSIYLINNKVYPCEYNLDFDIDLDNCKSIHDFWSNNNKFTEIKNNLVFNGICKRGK